MKTCKDCIYYEEHYLVEGEWEEHPEGACHLYPKPIPSNDEHWCGQLTQHLDDEITMHLERADRIKKKLGI